ncbi:MAG: TetR-like C-terminal domain-containing protein [bacterium]|nr:TetR-like C-terminal domain-containing protein [bacterium]
MNNQERNSYVRNQLTEALIFLLKKMPLSDISVSMLTREAKVGRVSFYRNYGKIEDILIQQDRFLINQWAEKFVEDPNSSINNVFGSLFQYYKDHADFYKLLVDNGLSDCMLTVIKERVGMSSNLPNKLAYKKAFFAYGLYGWLLEWMNKGMQEGADEIQAMLLDSI